jgi:hypothetical protein
VSRPLYCGAFRHFGSWRNALRAAGINAATVERRREWDKAKIVARLRELCSQRRSLRQTVVSRYDSGFCRAVCLNFGSWCNALVAAEINPESICRDPQWDRSCIIEAILLRVVRGEALGSTTVRPRTLRSAAVREFGSWAAALTAAGLEPAHYLRQRAVAQKERKKGGWSKDRVRKAILQRHALGLPLYGNAVLRDDRTLFVMIARCSLRGGHSSRVGPRHWCLPGLIRCRSMVTSIDRLAQTCVLLTRDSPCEGLFLGKHRAECNLTGARSPGWQRWGLGGHRIRRWRRGGVGRRAHAYHGTRGQCAPHRVPDLELFQELKWLLRPA